MKWTIGVWNNSPWTIRGTWYVTLAIGTPLAVWAVFVDRSRSEVFVLAVWAAMTLATLIACFIWALEMRYLLPALSRSRVGWLVEQENDTGIRSALKKAFFGSSGPTGASARNKGVTRRRK